jgi:hypothetical protein
MADLPKKRERPDRVLGLCVTKRLERLLLWSDDKRPSAGGKTIGESIKSSPFRSEGAPIIFPFLVIEAKSEKGRDGFSDIELQTAFTIRALLELQQDLRTLSMKLVNPRCSPWPGLCLTRESNGASLLLILSA